LTQIPPKRRYRTAKSSHHVVEVRVGAVVRIGYVERAVPEEFADEDDPKVKPAGEQVVPMGPRHCDGQVNGREVVDRGKAAQGAWVVVARAIQRRSSPVVHWGVNMPVRCSRTAHTASVDIKVGGVDHLTNWGATDVAGADDRDVHGASMTVAPPVTDPANTGTLEVLGRSGMPLSEHEQQILAQLEQSLQHDAPSLAKKAEVTVYGHAGRRVWWGVAGFVVGTVELVATFSFNVVVALGGVALMFASALYVERHVRLIGRAAKHDLTVGGRSSDTPSGLKWNPLGRFRR
jgi:Protein of unknown function (DUF3040)